MNNNYCPKCDDKVDDWLTHNCDITRLMLIGKVETDSVGITEYKSGYAVRAQDAAMRSVFEREIWEDSKS